MRSDVWAWWPDGRVVRISPGDGAYLQANVHPDGDGAVFWGGPDGSRPRLWRSPTDRADAIPLTGDDHGARHPTFGAGGTRIVFSADRAHGGTGTMADEGPAGTPPSGSWNIFSMAPDGSDVRQLTHGEHVDQRPALCADGTRVAFVSDRGRGLWLVDADGTSEPRQIGAGLLLYRPAWAPDGTALFTFRITAERRQAGRLDLATGEFVPFANDDRGNTHGPWPDPSGEVLLVHSDRDGRWGLHELPLDGGPMRPLRPPGHEDAICAHATRATNGVVTFDEAAMTDLTDRGATPPRAR